MPDDPVTRDVYGTPPSWQKRRPRSRTDTTYEDLAAAVLVAHQRADVGWCLCGWGEPGASHARHVARVLRQAGALRA